MLKTLWNGTLTLGELVIPVALASTVRDGGERFRKLHAACATPVSMRSYCARDEEILEREQLVSAFEVTPGEFLVLGEDELAALEPEESRVIPIAGFIAAGELDPLQPRKRYHLVPSKIAVGRRAYALLAGAMDELDVVALVRFVAWHSEQLGAVSSRGHVLELATLHFSEDIVRADEISIELASADLDLNEELRELAQQLVSRHTRGVRAEDFVSIERPRVRELLDAKLAGEKLIRPEPVGAAEPAPVTTIDLAGALKRSLKAAPRARRSRR